MTISTTAPLWTVGEPEQPEQALVVRSTTAYDMFCFEQVNREVDPKHVAELVEAIKEKNLLREYPIVVDIDLNIVDGQHRLSAARELGIPIFFIVSANATVADISRLNSYIGKWNISDHLHFHCMRGNQHYEKLHEFHQKYPFLSISTCRYLLSCNKQRGDDSFERGEFQVVRPELAEKTVKILLDFRRHASTLHKYFQFVNAVSIMISHPQYNHKRMLMKLEYLSSKLAKQVDTKAYLEMLGEIYNYKARTDDIVEFKQQTSQRRVIQKKG